MNDVSSTKSGSLSKDSSQRLAINAALTALVCLLTWRVWRFTLRPMLHPHEPKELPYWIPFIGHAGGFFKNFNDAVERGRKYFGTGELFSMTVAGQTIYIATSAKDINDVWRNFTSISIDPIAQDMYQWGGISPKSRKVLFIPRTWDHEGFGDSKVMIPNRMVNELHHQQLHPGSRLEELVTKKMMPVVFEQLNFRREKEVTVIKRSEKSITISLLQLCIETFVRGETEAFFGPKILELRPNLPQSFMDWEYTNWKLLFQLPAIFSADMLKARDELGDAFAMYFKLLPKNRPGATYFVTALQDLLREIGFNEEDMGKFMLFHYWAAVGNVYKLGFWLVAYLIRDPELMQAIRQEVMPAINDQSVDEKYLAEQCPRLDSLINEILRLSVTSSLGRTIIDTTVVGGKTLQKGNKIMLPIRELHFDSEIWGPTPESLSPTRFNGNPKLSKNLSYRPWGGGNMLCPGRFFARRSVTAFVAILLAKYEVALESSSFPKSDGARPSPGVIPVAQGEDMTLRLTPH